MPKQKHTQIEIVEPRPALDRVVVVNQTQPTRWIEVVCGALALLLLLSAIGAVSIGDIGKKVTTSEDPGRIAQLEQTIKDLEVDQELIILSSNLILAIQEVYYDTGAFPESLKELERSGQLAGEQGAQLARYTDRIIYAPHTDYFALCVQLSDEVRGVRTLECRDLMRR